MASAAEKRSDPKLASEASEFTSAVRHRRRFSLPWLWPQGRALHEKAAAQEGRGLEARNDRQPSRFSFCQRRLDSADTHNWLLAGEVFADVGRGFAVSD